MTALPASILALEDGGPYLSNRVVIAQDPDTGVRNASLQSDYGGWAGTTDYVDG